MEVQIDHYCFERRSSCYWAVRSEEEAAQIDDSTADYCAKGAVRTADDETAAAAVHCDLTAVGAVQIDRCDCENNSPATLREVRIVDSWEEAEIVLGWDASSRTRLGRCHGDRVDALMPFFWSVISAPLLMGEVPARL